MSCAPPDMRAPIDPGSPVTAEQAEATLTRLLAAAAAKGYEKGRDDERRRCTAHAEAAMTSALDACRNGAITTEVVRERQRSHRRAESLHEEIRSGKAAP